MTKITGIRSFSHRVAAMLCLAVTLAAGYAQAADDSLSPLDQALDQVQAKATSYNVGGSVDNNCTLSNSSNSICVGSYIWNDDHTNDSSTNKGALLMSGSVQQNLVSNINIDSAVAPVSASANIVSNVTPAAGSTINLSNSASSTGFLGGY
jgi:hypothetical protein